MTGWTTATAATAAVAATAGWVSTMRQLRHRNSELVAARKDPVTSVWNRHEWQTRAVPALPEATALLLLDVDDFKTVNDRFGHEAGDAVLRAVAQRLSTDRSISLVGRLGGDELVALATVNSPIEPTLDALWTKLTQPLSRQGYELPIGVSIGVAEITTLPTRQLSEALAAADQAMYTAKTLRTGWERYSRGAGLRHERPTTSICLAPRRRHGIPEPT